MKRGQRLRCRGDFAKVYSRGRSLAHPLLVVKACATGAEGSRIGFAVGRKLGGAVERNRARRRLRAAASKVSVLPGWDMVVIARPGVLTAGFEEIERALGHLLRRLGALGPSEGSAEGSEAGEG